MTNLEDRLDNWGRWLRSHPQYGSTESIEGNYRSPQCWWPIGPRPQAPKAADAWDLCLACATLAVRYHLTLKLIYVRQLDYRLVGRILRRELKERTTARDVPAVAGMGKVLLAEALSEPLAIRRVRARSRVARILNATLDLQVD